MRLGVRGRLFLASVLLLCVFGATGAIYLSIKLRPTLDAQLETELWRHARAAVEGINARGTDRLDEFADRMGEATDTRFSIVTRDGVVEGDTRLDGEQLANVEGHGDRPEVVAALNGRPKAARRRSATLGEELLYVALVAKDGHVVRVAKPIAQVDGVMSKIRSVLWVAAGLGLLGALFMSILASELLSRPLRRLVDSARALAGGRSTRLIPIDSQDVLGGLAGEINRLGNSLQEVVSTLAKERNRMQAVLAGTDEAVLSLDKDHNLVLANPASAKWIGGAEVGQPLGTETELYKALAPNLTDAQRSVEVELDGRWLLVRITPEPSLHGWIIMMLDITRLRRLEKMRQNFVANVSHELRTPISVIRANAETLLDGAIDDPIAGRRFLKALTRNAERLSNLIADLLDIARIEAGKQQIDIEPVDVGAVAALALESVEAQAHRHGVGITSEIAEELLALADAKALEQVLINLLENAIKYTSEETGSVVLHAEATATAVRIEVRDNGVGIPTEHRERIFDRFYRVDAGRSSAMGGTGLGLTIVKRLVASMNGEVAMTDNEPAGSVFWVELPKVDDVG